MRVSPPKSVSVIGDQPSTRTACSDSLLKELVREADVEWGRVQGERPHFEREGAPPDPDDPCTFASVRESLADLVEQLGGGGG
jgi:hypothetical protein